MKATNGIDNVRFEDNEHTLRAQEALKTILRKEEFWFLIRGYISGFDINTGDVIFFFPLADFSKVSQEIKNKFISDISNAWESSKFQIVKQENLPGDVYLHIGFRSLCFRLKSLI